MLRWLYDWTGLGDPSGPQYLFWSGIVGDLALLGIIGVLFKKVNCHAAGCWRIGLHHVEGTPYITCRKHHPVVPTGKVHVDHIHQAHNERT